MTNKERLELQANCWKDQLTKVEDQLHSELRAVGETRPAWNEDYQLYPWVYAVEYPNVIAARTIYEFVLAQTVAAWYLVDQEKCDRRIDHVD